MISEREKDRLYGIAEQMLRCEPVMRRLVEDADDHTNYGINHGMLAP